MTLGTLRFPANIARPRLGVYNADFVQGWLHGLREVRAGLCAECAKYADSCRKCAKYEPPGTYNADSLQRVLQEMREVRAGALAAASSAGLGNRARIQEGAMIA